MNEWGEMQYASGITGAALFAFLGIVATHFLYGLLIIGFGEVIDYLAEDLFPHGSGSEAAMGERTKREEKLSLPEGEVAVLGAAGSEGLL